MTGDRNFFNFIINSGAAGPTSICTFSLSELSTISTTILYFLRYQRMIPLHSIYLQNQFWIDGENKKDKDSACDVQNWREPPGQWWTLSSPGRAEQQQVNSVLLLSAATGDRGEPRDSGSTGGFGPSGRGQQQRDQ